MVFLAAGSSKGEIGSALPSVHFTTVGKVDFVEIGSWQEVEVPGMLNDGRLTKLRTPMNEYYRSIAEAVAKLENNTLDARHQLYERTRNILATVLGERVRDSELVCERRALEAAIQRVEDESVARNCIDVQKNGIAVESVCVSSIERESLQITTIEQESLQIGSNEAELPPSLSMDKTKSLLPAETTSAILEQYRRRAVMLRAIGTPRCLELAIHCEKMASAIEASEEWPPGADSGHVKV